jgi:intein-encoded DNA endonuclease-like protein
MAQGPGFCPEGEEVKKMEVNTAKTKRKKIQPRELRIKIYERAMTLHRQGLSNKEIRNVIEREFGVRLPMSTLCHWLHGKYSPYNKGYIPSLELLKPSEELSYVISVTLGDGYVCKERVVRKDRNDYDYDNYMIGLEVKDKELAVAFARCLTKVLERKPIKARYDKSAGRYVVRVRCKTLYELLKKPVDIKRIKKHVEHCLKCMAAFLRGLFDTEGCISKDGYIYLYNTNYEVLVYAQRLLRRFGIESTGPWPHKRKGTTTHNPTTGKQYKTNEDCYYLYIRTSSNTNFYRHIGFTIRRKQKRLEEYLRRTGKIYIRESYDSS